MREDALWTKDEQVEVDRLQAQTEALYVRFNVFDKVSGEMNMDGLAAMTAHLKANPPADVPQPRKAAPPPPATPMHAKQRERERLLALMRGIG